MMAKNQSEPSIEGVVLRPCFENDLPRVLEIEEASFPLPWKREFFLSELHNPHSYFWVVEKAGYVIGYLCCWFVADEGEILNIAIDPRYRRCGFGKILIKEVITVAYQRGVHTLYLEARVSNTTAISLYKSFNFHEAGVRQRYYADGEDALLMVRKDI
jgi:ribosomal-protein-alanine N-acetyltransferase